MIQSMTGFGKAELQEEDIIYTIEIRSLNSRFFELSTRLPKQLLTYEHEFRNLLKKRMGRGKAQLYIAEAKYSGKLHRIGFSPEAVSSIANELREAAENADLKDDLTLSDIVQLGEWLVPEENDDLAEKKLEIALKGVEIALDEYDKSRIAEGKNLEEDFRKRISILNEVLVEIEQKAEQNKEMMHQKILERINQYIPNEKIDQDRLAQEVVYMIEKIDITEEIVRLRSHIDLFNEALENKEDTGKRLNFILQEMNREVNTIGSKAIDSSITTHVVQAKDELEKMREQVQNVL